MNGIIRAIVIVQDSNYLNITNPEIATAQEELTEQGVQICAVTSIPDAIEQNTLYLTDNTAYYETMRANGYPSIGYLHIGNQNAVFEHCPYLISEPQWVDVDSYTKIYQRLVGLPWTILTTDHLIIREMTERDLDALYDLYDDIAIQFMQPLNPDRDVERSQLQDYIDKIYGLFGYGYWALELKSSGQMIGRMGFAAYEGSDNCIPFGYIIHHDYRRQGYALEAARAILPYARDVLQMRGICAEVHANNEPSIAFLKSLGFCKKRVIGDIITYVL